MTDVLSFPLLDFDHGVLQREPGPGDLDRDEDGEATRLHLGDLVICPQRALEQAEASGHSFLREVVYLAVHGCLHIFGFDHADEGEELEMRRLASGIMGELGLGLEGEDGADDEDAPEITRAGFIALLGRPNVGKSTLLNELVGNRLAITTHKAQTTRHTIRGIVNRGESQFIFVDTPGLHAPKHRLGERMMRRSLEAARDADILVLVLDAARGRLRPEELELVEQARASRQPLVVVLNKIDRQPREALLPVIAQLAEQLPGTELLPMSALKGDGVEQLLDILEPLLPEGPALFDREAFTDQTERQLVAELLREQILLQIHEEIPHGTGVQVESFEEEYDETGERRLVRIEASIVCDRDNHKAILIGRKGRTMKAIGSRARTRIEAMLDAKVYLELFVKVRQDWRNRPGILNDYDAGGPLGSV